MARHAGATQPMSGENGAAADNFDSVNDHVMNRFVDLVEELGGDPRMVLDRAHIDADAFFGGQRGVTYRQVVDVMHLAALHLECPDFGMRLGLLQADGLCSPLLQVLKNSRTFGEGIEFVTRHNHVHSVAASIWLRRSRADGTAMLGHDILLDGLPNRAQAMEQVLMVAHLSAMEATGGVVRARSIGFRHEPLSPLRTYRRYFGCEVRFGQQADTILFRDADLACPIFRPDAFAYQAATAFIDSHFPHRHPPLHANVRGLLMHFLGTDQCTNRRVASQLNMHSRTLHRRLEQEGTSFQRIKNEVRRDMMLYYLSQTMLDLAHVSERLGFAEQSAMTRACRKWFGKPPTAVRVQAAITDRAGNFV